MAVSYKFIEGDLLGLSNATDVDTAPRFNLGTIARAFDVTYGEGEFIYVKFTGSTAIAAGDFVAINRGEMLAVQAASGSLVTGRGEIGVAMAAVALNTTTPQYGWVMIRGVHDGANVATGTTKNVALYLSTTAGRASATVVSNYKADGVIGRVADAASNVGAVELLWPTCTGNG